MNSWPDAMRETSLGKLADTQYVQENEVPSCEKEQVSYGIKDLNLKHCYASDKPVSVKEHLQNWRDRCVEIGEMMHSKYDFSRDLQPSVIQENGWNILIYYCLDKILGWIAFKHNTEGYLHMELFNAATSLTPDSVLVMGQTSKASRVLAGHFGEGVKVEVNRLLDLGASVVYFTNNSLWEFFYSEKHILHTRITSCNSPFGVTRIQLTNVPACAYCPEEFLFICPCSTKFIAAPKLRDTHSLSGLEVLLDSHTSRKIYVHGIFVMDLNIGNKVAFGLNYTGRCIMTKLKIGRDRDRLELSSLTDLIPSVFEENKSHPHIRLLSKVFYDALLCMEREKYYFTPNRMRVFSSDKATDLMADCMVSIFLEEHGPTTVPSENIGPDIVKEADLFDFKILKIENPLLEWLVESEMCPTLEKLWRQNSEAVLNLPEFIFDDVYPDYPVSMTLALPNDQAEFARSIRVAVSQYFDDSRFGTMCRLKDFSGLKKQNKRRFIPIKFPGSSSPDLFVFDANLLDSSLVHQELRKKDSQFFCEGNCGCVINAIIEDILDSVDIKKKADLDSKFRRKFLNSLPTNLKMPPSSVAPAPEPENSPHFMGGQPQLDDDNSYFNEPHTSESSYLGTNKSLQCQDDERALLKENIRNRKSEHGSLQNLPVQFNGVSARCCQNLTEPQAGSFVSPAILENKLARLCTVKEEVAYQHVGVHGGMKVFVDSVDFSRLQNMLGSDQNQSLHALVACVRLLARVFQYPIEKCHVVVEDTSTIAFNRNGNIFFNLLAMRAIFDKGPQYAFDFWFPTFCHELAHNQVEDHDETFATTMGILVKQHLQSYRQAFSWLENSNSMQSWQIFEEVSATVS